MKVYFEEDFIYYQSGFDSFLILKNCNSSCVFCPAVKLKSFYNYPKLSELFDFKSKTLTIYGSVNISYIETFLKKYLQLNPSGKIHVVGCYCEFTQNIPVSYSHVIHISLENHFSILPKEFFIPAIGDPVLVSALALKYLKKYPNIPIRADRLDSGDVNADFWTQDKIEEFQKKINCKDFRI